MKRPLILACALATFACDSSTTEPTAPEKLSISANQGATTTFSQFTVNFNFQAYSACLDAFVTMGGPVEFSVWTVVRPDGSRHITQLLDVSNTAIRYNGIVWTPGPNASEMFIRNLPAGSPEQQLEHQGTVIYRSPDSETELRLQHRINLVRLPDGTLQLNNNDFSIVCVGN